MDGERHFGVAPRIVQPQQRARFGHDLDEIDPAVFLRRAHDEGAARPERERRIPFSRPGGEYADRRLGCRRGWRAIEQGNLEGFGRAAQPLRVERLRAFTQG